MTDITSAKAVVTSASQATTPSTSYAMSAASVQQVTDVLKKVDKVLAGSVQTSSDEEKREVSTSYQRP